MMIAQLGDTLDIKGTFNENPGHKAEFDDSHQKNQAKA